MPYAIDGQISQDPLVGGIEISDAQYAAAIEGMVAGLVVTISGGFNVGPAVEESPIEPAPVDPVAVAVAECARRRAIADYAIPPLQDAVDIDDATTADIALLKAWKKYRVELNRLPDQAGWPDSINWPVAPPEENSP
ncbi:tail fiber assembly protein [Pseudomonas sp. JQ36]